MTDDAARFWSKVDVRGPNECWNWKAGRFTTGYGAFSFRGRAWHAPRVAYTLAKGEIPDGKLVMHSCDNPLCCNPAHISAGTNADNSADMAAKGRACQGDDHWTRQRPEDLPHGADVVGAVLDANLVKHIRAEYAKGCGSDQIAEELGINKSTVHRAATGKTWKHIEMDPAHVPLPGEIRRKSFDRTYARGENASHAVVTEEIVRAIRAEYKPGYGELTRLSDKYGIKVCTIDAIVKRRNWKWLN